MAPGKVHRTLLILPQRPSNLRQPFHSAVYNRRFQSLRPVSDLEYVHLSPMPTSLVVSSLRKPGRCSPNPARFFANSPHNSRSLDSRMARHG